MTQTGDFCTWRYDLKKGCLYIAPHSDQAKQWVANRFSPVAIKFCNALEFTSEDLYHSTSKEIVAAGLTIGRGAGMNPRFIRTFRVKG